MNEPQATNEHDPPDSVAGAADRRRPGRVEYRNPILIALLRRSLRYRNAEGDGEPETRDDGDDDRKVPAAIAIAFIVLVSVLLWALIGIGFRMLFG